jgi:hypothetical protein
MKTGERRIVRECGISRGSFDETIEPSRKLASIFSPLPAQLFRRARFSELIGSLWQKKLGKVMGLTEEALEG